MRKNLLVLSSMLVVISGFPVFAITNEEFFNYSKEAINKMEVNDELEGRSKHEVMWSMLKTMDMHYECSRMDFNAIVYERCATVNMVAKLPDGNGGFLGGMGVGGAVGAIGSRVADRVIDRGLDHVERKVERVKKDIEASDRRERESRARERERSSRCNHSAPSYRGGDCA